MYAKFLGPTGMKVKKKLYYEILLRVENLIAFLESISPLDKITMSLDNNFLTSLP